MENTVWLHVSKGHFYSITGIGLREADLEPTLSYRRLDDKTGMAKGVTFYRPVTEFLDGRFTQYNVNGTGGELPWNVPASKVKTDGKKPTRLARDTNGRHLDIGDHVNHVGFPRGQVMSAEEANNWGDYGKRTIAEIFASDIVKLTGTPNVMWDSRALELVPFDD